MTKEEISAIEKYIAFRETELEILKGKIEENSFSTYKSMPLTLKKIDYEINSKNWDKYLEKEANLKNELHSLKENKKIIYKIDLVTPDVNNVILQRAEDYKLNKERKEKGIALSRINKSAESNVLYIGSSENGIEKRLKEHLGFGTKSTYSMQLHHWISTLNIQELAISINLYIQEEAIGSLMLKNIEYAFWNYYKPLLGKGELDLDIDKL